MGEPTAAPLLLDPVAQAVSAARRYVVGVLLDLGAPGLRDSAELGVSELVTNAVLHGRAPIVVTVRRDDAGTVRVEVLDRSALALQHRRLSTFATTGRGLRLVASLSSAWGVETLPAEQGPGKIVWFAPLVEPTETGFADADWASDLHELLN